MKRILIILTLLYSQQVFCQSVKELPIWANAKKLAKEGLYHQVVLEADSIYQLSLKNGDELNQIASVLVKAHYLSQYSEQSFEFIQSAIDQSEGAVKSMLNSYYSTVFLNYYRNHQWEIRNRLETTGIIPEDIEFWSQQNFADKIESLIEKSLENTDALLLEKTTDWSDLFEYGHGSHTIEPTLYEYIAWQAIEFYQSYEFSQQLENDMVILKDPSLLGTYKSFSKMKFGDWDELCFKEKSLVLYQKIIEKNKSNEIPRALLYEELKRLDYLKSKVSIENPDDLIRKNLESLFEEFKGQKGSEIIAERLISLYTNADALEEDYIKADLLCQIMIDSKVNEKEFEVLKKQINRKDLGFLIPATIIPLQPQMAKISYKNIDKAYFRIIRTDEYKALNTNHLQGLNFNNYTHLEAISSFEIQVSNKAQVAPHTALFEFPSLDYGSYIILASSGPDFIDGEDELAIGAFQVSYIDMVVMKSDNQFMVIDRMTGKPITDAQVKVYKEAWENSTRTYFSTQISSSKTDSKGILQLNWEESNIKIHFEIAKGSDEWISPNTYMNRKRKASAAREKCHFYLDRAIYRPGQTVYFKGIITEENGNNISLIPQKTKEIKLYSTQGKVLHTIQLTSNDYGSFAGSFVLPLGGMTGNMRISGGKGSTNFRVEEYKRPKFEIVLESPDQEYQINDEVSIKGMSMYYAGSPLQNAKVKYRISRGVYMPWRWTCWIPQSKEIPISAGETISNEKGEFDISFKAIANEETKLISWYHYTITAEVTDANGETHSQNLSVNLGSRSLFMESDLPQLMDKDQATDVSIKAKTPNQKTIHTQITILLEKLRAPTEIFRAPLWETDTVLIAEADIKENDLHLKAKNRLEDFEVEAKVFEKYLDTKIDSIIPRTIFKSLDKGAYKMTLSCLDKNGKEVQEIKYMELFSSESKELAFAKESFFHVDKNSALVDDTIQISIGSTHKKQNYFYHISSGDQIYISEWKKLKGGMDVYSLPIKEEFRGGLNIQLFFENNNQLFAYNKQINVPFDNKDLEVQLVTLRNPMEPGNKEHWTLWIKDYKDQAANAEILASMYDASLDVFATNNWTHQFYNTSSYMDSWRSLQHYFSCYQNSIFTQAVHFPQIHGLNLWNGSIYGPLINRDYTRSGGAMNVAPTMVQKSDGVSADVGEISEMEVSDDLDIYEETIMEDSGNPDKEDNTKTISPRKNLKETAFFYPQLSTDKDGYTQLKFTSPEALSTWKLMVLAHSKDMQVGYFSKEVITQKQLMVMPNLPRFLRGGDHISISTNVINLLEEEQRVSAELQILDAITKEALDLFAEGQMQEHFLTITAKGQTEVSWKIEVPETVGAVIIRVLAKGPAHTDAEEHTLPVLSQLHFLTETYPFILSSQNNITAEDLNLNKKSRLDQDVMTLEITTNPLWYVVQALPNFEQPQKPNALSWFNYYFVQSMAADIVKKNPEIEDVFKQWQQLSPEELQSELFQNPELKKVMIEETPWLLNAENQTDRKREIARLFDKNQMDYQLEKALNKLQELQKSNGGFGWIDGMKTSIYISSQIAEGLGQLMEAGILDLDKNYSLKNMIKTLVEYLDQELNIAYGKAQMKEAKYYSGQAIRIMQARSYFLASHPLNHDQAAFEYFMKEWKEQKHPQSLNERMQMAKVLWYHGDLEEAKKLILAFKDIALKDENGGVYWRDFQRYESARKQAEMIELFELCEMEKEWVEGMKLWLLQQKRANDWGDQKSTAQACFAMLNHSNKLSESPEVYLSLGTEEIKIDGNAGTGYFKITWQGQEIESALQNLKIRKEGEGMIFGAFYDQYFETMSQIEAHDGGVEIEKQIFVAKTKEGQNELTPLTEDTPIDLGDRILVRMLIKNEQAMDFVHLRDYLPAGFESQNQLSGYRWQGNISYYQSPGDVATDYFIAHLPKGLFLIEYELNATISGHLNLGPSEIQSLYAPEFGGHSDGGMIEVRK